MKLKGIELKGTYKVRYYSTWFEVYDEKDNVIYFENSKAYWAKWEYDEKGNRSYYEDSNGYWEKWEYDEKGYVIYYENSKGFWEKSKYDEKGNVIYRENNNGKIIDERVKELTIEEIEKLLGYRIKIKEIYFENSNDYWVESEYNEKDNRSYYILKKNMKIIKTGNKN